MTHEEIERTKSILRELLEYTRELSLCTDNRELDISGLTRMCRHNLRLLQNDNVSANSIQSTRPGQAEENLAKDAQVYNLLSVLARATEQSISALRQRKDQIEDELNGLRRSKKAVNAYRGRK
ncbi:MAG: hypothetical protein RBS57_04215 [Desulforhabdus sp.]|nr:hypothetical protein [Desulforhabdus sp.]